MEFRRVVAMVATAFAALGLTAAYVALQLDQVVSTPDRFTDAAPELLAEPEVREELVDRLALAIATQYAGELELARSLGIEGVDNANETFIAIADATVASPEFLATWTLAIADVHRAAFDDPTYTPVLDTAALTAAATRAAAEIEPRLVPLLEQGDRLRVTVARDDIPDLSSFSSRNATLRLVGIAVAALGATMAIAVHPRPWTPGLVLGTVAMVLGASTFAITWLGAEAFGIVVGDQVGDNEAVAERVFGLALSSFEQGARWCVVLGAAIAALAWAWQLSAARPTTHRGDVRAPHAPAFPPSA